jgi:hypothetical protein
MEKGWKQVVTIMDHGCVELLLAHDHTIHRINLLLCIVLCCALVTVGPLTVPDAA